MSPGQRLASINLGARHQAMVRILEARARGATLRQAAAAGGVHVATLCRWARSDPWIRRFLDAYRPRKRPQVRNPPLAWHRICPLCGCLAQVRCARFGRRFWRCTRWPACTWASWQPRHPEDCSACGGPRYWQRGGKMVRCSTCGLLDYL